eukprot:5407561-Pyramimonas_sp.AAC.1
MQTSRSSWLMGHITPPVVEAANQQHNVFRSKTQEEHCDAWLSYIYHHLAEHRADMKVKSIDSGPGQGVADYTTECPRPASTPAGAEDGSKPTTPK